MVNACKTIADYPSANGSMAFWYSIRDCVPYAFSAILLAIFLVLFFGNYFIIKSRTSRAKILVPFLSSSIITMILSLFLAFAQLVSFMTVVFWAFVSIIAYIFMHISDNF